MKHEIEYHHLALMQLDKAIDLYEEATIQGYVCAVTLAGAAEEILKKLCKDNGIQTSLDAVLDDLCKKFPEFSKEDVRNYVLNLPRNALKHLKPEICENDFDPELYARMYIHRTIYNYCKLTNEKSDAIDRFLEVKKKVA